MKKNLGLCKVLRVIGAIVGALLFLWFLLPYMVAGILNIGNMTGMVVSVVLLLYVLFASLIHAWIKEAWKKNGARWVLTGMGAVLVGIAMLAVVETGCMISVNMKKPA